MESATVSREFHEKLIKRYEMAMTMCRWSWLAVVFIAVALTGGHWAIATVVALTYGFISVKKVDGWKELKSKPWTTARDFILVSLVGWIIGSVGAWFIEAFISKE